MPVCMRTGEVFMTQEIMEKLKGPGYCDQVQTSEQVGSQFWMNQGYAGPEPSMEVKAAFSTADYARDWIGIYARSLVGAGVHVSPTVAGMAATYPVRTQGLEQLFAAAPQVGPAAAVQAAVPDQLTASDVAKLINQAISGAPAGSSDSGSQTGGGGGGGGGFDWTSLLLPGLLVLGAVLLLPSLMRGSGTRG